MVAIKKTIIIHCYLNDWQTIVYYVCTTPGGAPEVLRAGDVSVPERQATHGTRACVHDQ